MPLSLPQAADLFADTTDLAGRMEDFTSAVNAAVADADAGKVSLAVDSDGVYKAMRSDASPAADLLAKLDELGKTASPEVLASISGQLDAAKGLVADLTKDFTTTSPFSTGAVAYDLQAPAKFLVPVRTPLRNLLPRTSGLGLVARFKQILGITGSGTGGVADLHPGITESTSNTFGATTFNRPPKISYASADVNRNYKQFGLSDNVTWAAQYAGQGFQDIRALSQAAVLYASMLEEEKMLLGGRGTDSGYVGALAAPTVTLAARAKAGSEVGLSGTGTAYVYVQSDAVFGGSVLSTVQSQAWTAGQVIDVTLTDVGGACGYRIWAGTSTGAANAYYQGRTGYNKFTLGASSSALLNAGSAASVVVTGDATAYASGYDGLLSIAADTNQSGYVNRLNTTFSTANSGVEFQNAFVSLYAAVKADPDAVWLAGQDRKQLADTAKVAGSASNYRFSMSQSDASGFVYGTNLTGIVNEVTGKMVALNTHPWMPQGNAAIASYTLPVPNSNVGNVWEVRNVQDYMGISWPVVDLNFAYSSYWFGTFLCYAPAWNGAIQGIQAA